MKNILSIDYPTPVKPGKGSVAYLNFSKDKDSNESIRIGKITFESGDSCSLLEKILETKQYELEAGY